MKEYIRLDPITERKLIVEIEKLHYRIPEDDYINISNIIFSCIQKHTISIPQIYQIISLLSEKQTKTIIRAKALKGKFKVKKIEKPQLLYRFITYNENNILLIEFDRRNIICKLLFALLFLNFHQQSENKGLFNINS